MYQINNNESKKHQKGYLVLPKIQKDKQKKSHILAEEGQMTKMPTGPKTTKLGGNDVYLKMNYQIIKCN